MADLQKGARFAVRLCRIGASFAPVGRSKDIAHLESRRGMRAIALDALIGIRGDRLWREQPAASVD
ncbi:hypothetical protein ACYT84_18690 [Ralstonia solanacearum]|uniref:hypothetical protein n=1 Tax=Ralstonia solanacearum TaxID=305 RepID=UPI0018D10C62|nr:hypothetical protein [Ralstonia solanacearum]